MTDAQEFVIHWLVQNGEERGLHGRNLFLADEIAGADVEAIVVVDVFTDGKHGIGSRDGRRRLHQLDVGIGVGQVVSVDGADAAIV